MAITIDYGNTWVINIPQADLTLVSGTLYELDTETFRQALLDLADDPDGMSFQDTHTRNAPVTISGVTFAQTIEILPPYKVQFENGSYSVRLVGSNNNIFDVEAGILVQNNVQVISANAAGLISPSSITALLTRQENASYQGTVHIDAAAGTAGTAWPIGTASSPVDNLTDALAIAASVSADTFQIAGSLTLDQTVNGFRFLGLNRTSDSIALNSQDVDGCAFSRINISGTGTGEVDVVECALTNVNGLHGEFHRSSFSGTMTATTGNYIFHLCFSEVAGSGRPTFDFNGLNVAVSFRTYSGGLNLVNCSHASTAVSVDLDSGMLDVAASCTAGELVLRGVGNLIDNSAGMTLTKVGFVDAIDLKIAKAINGNRVDVTGTGPFTVDIYDDDAVTIMRTLTVSADGKLRTVV